MGRNRHRKRKFQDGPGGKQKQNEWKPNERNYKLPERKNEMFVKYYQEQKIVPEQEWEEFAEILKKDLPVTFRITGSRSQAQQLLEFIKGHYFNSLFDQKKSTTTPAGEEIPVEPPKALPWYPEELAWQIDMSRKYIRGNSVMKKLHDFLIAETESGNISRQEAVSMIPPLLLDIKSHHKILDMCAAPGSKTSQLIEYLHADDSKRIPEGFVMANDVDNKRCYLMVHQVKRIQSPNFMIVNQDASIFPKVRTTEENEKPEFMLFDRILADVPCTGDGTMRKNPDVWAKWKPQNGPNLHFIQLKILKRGLELLNEGGRLVYSTCSFNPVEDEAVVSTLLKQCQGSVELVDVSQSLPDLKSVPGLSTWRLMSADGEWFDSFENVPKSSWGIFRPSMFPPTEEDAKRMHLERCMRILPHHQNTGGFFICALTKVSKLPWMKEMKPSVLGHTKSDEVGEKTEKPDNNEGEITPEGTTDSDKKESENDEKPPAKKPRVYGFKEDPFLFSTPDDKIWPAIREFYDMPDDFPFTQVMFRSEQGNKKNLYFVSNNIRTVVKCNKERIKFINMGMKLLSRNPSPIVPECDFRLNQECLSLMYEWFPKRYIRVTKNDVVMLLSEENPYTIKFDPATQTSLEKIGPGSTIFHFKPTEKDPEPKCDLIFCGWKGKVSLRSFVSPFDRQHYLMLCGQDLQDIRDRVAVEKAGKKVTEENECKTVSASKKQEGEVDDMIDEADGADVSDGEGGTNLGGQVGLPSEEVSKQDTVLTQDTETSEKKT